MVDADLFILEAFAADPTQSQRQIARAAGLPLSKAHFVLRRLMEKGLVKMRRAAKSKHRLGYAYLLTPRGIEAKARLTYRFMERAAADYQRMRVRVDAALDAALLAAASGAPARTSAGTAAGVAAPVPAEVPAPEATPARPVPVCVLGDGPLGEVVRDVLDAREDTTLVPSPAAARLAVVVDPDAPQPENARGLAYVRLA